MTNRKILDYVIKGLYNEIHYKEKELKRINGAIYTLKNNRLVKGKYSKYTLSKLQQLRNEFKQDIKALKKEYNQLVFDVDRKKFKSSLRRKLSSLICYFFLCKKIQKR